MTTAGRLLAGLAVAGGIVLLVPPVPASAHPLGNFTVNQHTVLRVERESVTVNLIVDMAEIPAFQARSEIDGDGNQHVDRREAERYRTRACATLAGGTAVRLDGEALGLQVRDSALAFPPGQAGLSTLRLSCHLGSDEIGPTTGHRLELDNNNYKERVGWREVVAVGHGMEIAETDVAARSTSRELTAYPEDLLSSPLDVRHATVVVGRPTAVPGADPTRTEAALGGESRGPMDGGADRFTSAFTNLVARQELTVGFGLLALVSAVALGAVHALAPGHGKTVMAAYLVGQRGSLRQAALLGLSVTTTHTAGVLVLGLLLSGSVTFVPERLYPWLGFTSGATLAVVGVGLLRRAWRHRGSAVTISQDHDHDHGHGHHHEHAHQPPMSRKALMAVGAAGGLVPSPSALVVLLGAIALGRTWFGIALVLGYGVGMTLTLVAAGLLLVRARTTLEDRFAQHRAAAIRVLPLATASLVVVAGVGLAARAASQV